MELLIESELVSRRKLSALMTEADELTRVMVAIVRTLKRDR
jgi:hypothetical protein